MRYSLILAAAAAVTVVSAFSPGRNARPSICNPLRTGLVEEKHALLSPDHTYTGDYNCGEASPDDDKRGGTVSPEDTYTGNYKPEEVSGDDSYIGNYKRAAHGPVDTYPGNYRRGEDDTYTGNYKHGKASPDDTHTSNY